MHNSILMTYTKYLNMNRIAVTNIQILIQGLGRGSATHHMRIPSNNGAMHIWCAAPSGTPHTSGAPHNHIIKSLKCANTLFRSL